VAGTELNSLANGSGILGTEYDNSNGTTGLWPYLSLLELNVTFGTNPTAGSLISLYLITAPDGTNYDDTQANPMAFIGAFWLRAVTTAQKTNIIPGGGQAYILLPPCKFKLYVVNGSGQAFPASGSTIKGLLTRYQQV
jgi:hypothetical protein